jgi:putative hydrolase of the HAD superfamily
MASKVLLWDFDGTLGYRKDGMWGASIIETLVEYDLLTSLTASDFRPFLISGFPWHNPEITHTHVTLTDEWWQPILSKFAEGYMHYGIDSKKSIELAKITRQKFLNIERWALFEDTIETLNLLRDHGWKHAIVSNHVPELKDIVKALGIWEIIDYSINSAEIGYEKPNPGIYEYALELTSRPKEVWMIGNNIEADYLGAEAVGIQSILVHNSDSRAIRNCKELIEVINIIEG